MYVCICNAVTEREVESAIRAGADSVEQLKEQLQIAGCCGMCSETIECCLEESRYPQVA